MHTPLWDADCRQCHAKFATKGEGFDGEAFHDQAGHNSNLGVPCVDCHGAHETTVDPRVWFLDPPGVRARCAQCHIEYAAR